MDTLMRTPLILILLAAVAAPAAAQDPTVRHVIRIGIADEIERQQTRQERERLQRERERQQLERERERERLERQRERERLDRERAREQEARDRERAREQAQRDRERARDRASQRQDGIQEIERTTRTLRIGATGELHLSNVSGDITISRGGGNEAIVEIVKTARGNSSEDAREQLALVSIDVVERGTRAEVRTTYPHGEEMRRNNRRNINVWVAFNVTVPPGARVRANSVSGSVSARDIKGDVVLKSVSGTIRLANGGGTSTAESISGHVEVSDTALGGGLTASSASGHVVLKRVKANQLDLNSISGNVVMDDVECSRIEAQTVSGSVRFSGVLPKSARYELSSHSGNVSVAVSGAGFEVDATSFSGSVRSDFPLNGGDTDPGRRRPRSLRGVFGDGSAVLDLTTFSGSIVITKR